MPFLASCDLGQVPLPLEALVFLISEMRIIIIPNPQGLGEG